MTKQTRMYTVEFKHSKHNAIMKFEGISADTEEKAKEIGDAILYDEHPKNIADLWVVTAATLEQIK